MTIGYNEIHRLETPILEVGEDSFPGKFMFSISDTSSEDLPESVFPYSGNHKQRFVDVLDLVSHPEI
jgi:hypothetical protein